MENNQFQNNQQYASQQFPQQPMRQQFVQPQAYAPVKQKNNISFDFLTGPDKNKFIFAGAARLAVNLVTGILSAIYTLILRSTYISSTGFSSAIGSVYNILSSVVTIAILFALGYMLYKEITSTLKFAGVVILGGIIGSAVSNIFGTVLYLILGIVGAYGTIFSIANFLVGAIAWVLGAVASVALLAIIENKIDLTKFFSSKPKYVVPQQAVMQPVPQQADFNNVSHQTNTNNNF